MTLSNIKSELARQTRKSYFRPRQNVIHLTEKQFFDYLKDDLKMGNIEMTKQSLRFYPKINTVEISLCYPDLPDNEIKKIEICLEDVRAADNIQVSYDKKRDGWSIKQASVFSWAADDPECDPDWQEVAFIQAWAREKLTLQDGNDKNDLFSVVSKMIVESSHFDDDLKADALKTWDKMCHRTEVHSDKD